MLRRRRPGSARATFFTEARLTSWPRIGGRAPGLCRPRVSTASWRTGSGAAARRGTWCAGDEDDDDYDDTDDDDDDDDTDDGVQAGRVQRPGDLCQGRVDDV